MAIHITAVFEKEDDTYIGYCPEVPGANGQGRSIDECRENLLEAIELVLRDRWEDALKTIPDDAIKEKLVIA